MNHTHATWSNTASNSCIFVIRTGLRILFQDRWSPCLSCYKPDKNAKLLRSVVRCMNFGSFMRKCFIWGKRLRFKSRQMLGWRFSRIQSMFHGFMMIRSSILNRRQTCWTRLIFEKKLENGKEEKVKKGLPSLKILWASLLGNPKRLRL